jgi:hypothetical protein
MFSMVCQVVLGAQEWKGGRYEGRTIFEIAPAGQRATGW